MKLLLIGVWLVFIATQVWSNYSKIKSGIYIKHWEEAARRVVFGVLLAILFNPSVYWYYSLPMMGWIFWLFFDLGLNVARFGWSKFLYLGNGAFTDHIQKWNPLVSFYIKFFMMVVSISFVMYDGAVPLSEMFQRIIGK